MSRAEELNLLLNLGQYVGSQAIVKTYDRLEMPGTLTEVCSHEDGKLLFYVTPDVGGSRTCIAFGIDHMHVVYEQNVLGKKIVITKGGAAEARWDKEVHIILGSEDCKGECHG